LSERLPHDKFPRTLIRGKGRGGDCKWKGDRIGERKGEEGMGMGKQESGRGKYGVGVKIFSCLPISTDLLVVQ